MQPIGQTLPVQLTLALGDAKDHSARSSDDALKDAAQKLEATFLAEMLKHAGVGETPDGFGGGVGEENITVHRVPLADIRSFIDAKRADGCGIDVRMLLLLGQNILAGE